MDRRSPGRGGTVKASREEQSRKASDGMAESLEPYPIDTC
jgi:hypothetical protein